MIGDLRLFAWLKATREGEFDPQTVTITLLDERAHAGRAGGCCSSAQPKKWVGPTLAAKGGGEVAMEELHLVAEQLDFQSS